MGWTDWIIYIKLQAIHIVRESWYWIQDTVWDDTFGLNPNRHKRKKPKKQEMNRKSLRNKPSKKNIKEEDSDFGELTIRPSLLNMKKKILVLDLDETLVHSSSRGSRYHDHVIEVLIEKHVCLYYVYKRPHVDYFLKKVSEWYKVVIFTASLPEYADPVIDWLDSRLCVISKRFFRDVKRLFYLKSLF